MKKLDAWKGITGFFVTLCLGTALFLGGCGAERSPMGSAAAEEPAAKKGKIDPGKPAPEPVPELSVSQWVTPALGGALYIADKGDKECAVDDMKAALAVDPFAVEEDVEITMKVSGETLSDLAVTFQPGGLKFAQPALLTVKLGSERVTGEVHSLVVKHEYADGTVETAEISKIKTQKEGDITMISVVVPGFSRYSMGGGKRKGK